MIKGNKGEWSELYVLITLLANGKLHQSDINLEKDTGNIYEIVKGYKEETDYKLEFDRNDGVNVFRIDEGVRKKIGNYDLSLFNDISKILYKGIKSGKGKSFGIPSVKQYLDTFNISKLKADSKSKADINLRIYDHRLAKETDLGFSIKSLLGNNSTLFNTGYGNNFIYKVSDNLNKSISEFNKETYKPTGGISKITHRLNTLKTQRCDISYKEIQSKQLWKNLKMIDGDLPQILAYALYYRWTNRMRSLREVSDFLEQKDPLNFYDNQVSEQKLYEYKLKKFLTESAMGMTSENPWLGEYDAFGGVIIAKRDGDIVCFHIYDFNLLRNYLLNNTVFEQPSTGEDEQNPGNRRKKGKKYYYGWLEKEGKELIFKINLQIRFK